jgi:hypothetical protein
LIRGVRSIEMSEQPAVSRRARRVAVIRMREVYREG